MQRGPQAVTCHRFLAVSSQAAPAGPGFSMRALCDSSHQQNGLGCKAKALGSQPPQPTASWHQGLSTESSGLGPDLPKVGLVTTR